MEQAAIILGVVVIVVVAAFLVGTVSGARKQQIKDAEARAEAMKERKESDEEINGMDDIAVHERLNRWRLPDGG